MNILRALTCGASALFVALSLAGQVGAQERSQNKDQIHYKVIDLGTLGGTMGFATGINNKGWVEGVSSVAGDSSFHAFLWRNGVMNDLGTLGGPNSGSSFFLTGWGPNERGQVVSSSDTMLSDPFGNDLCGYGTYLMCHAFIWQHGVMSDLGTLGGNNSLASTINNRGQASGFAENAVPDATCQPPQVFQMKPVIWEKGAIRELPTLPGDPDGWAVGINDTGQAVGATGNCANSPESFWGALAHHAVIWEKGKVKNLGGFGGQFWNFALNINNNGQVVGYSDLPGDTSNHAFLWQDGIMMDLGTLPGDISSAALTINDKGQIVGQSTDEDFNSTAVLWERGIITDLNSLIAPDSPLYLVFAISINPRGEIVGFALHTQSGELHAYLATPEECEVTCVESSRTQRIPKAKLTDRARELLRQHTGLLHRIRTEMPAR